METQPSQMPTTRRPKLGDMLVEANIISAVQLKSALEFQHAHDVKLGEALISLNFLTAEALNDFLNNQRKSLMMGDLMVKAGKITFQQLQETLKEQKRSGSRFGEALVTLGFLNELGFAQFFAKHIGVTCLDLSTINIEEATVKMMEEEAIRRLRAIAVKRAGGGVLVGMVDPTDLLAYDEVCQSLRRPVEVGLILEKQMRQVLDRVFRKTGEIQGLMQELGEEMSRNRLDLNQFVKTEMVQDAPVVKILQTLFEDSLRQNASDIHIEPGQHVLRIRKRIDGVLHEQIIREKGVSVPLLSKLKLMAGLEISERRLSQGGRFSLKVGDMDVDVRLSTMPTENGESAVLRLLNQSSGLTRLNRTGLAEDAIKRIDKWIHKPHGLVLVTGPTGSGKSTTLYAALNELNTPGKKIITVEDPVEYRLDRIIQVQVNPKIGLTFASVLRTVLRQDPDIVLVGEMRDEETCDIAIRAALTGHLVLSTLHTNNAVSTVIRLFEIGARGFAVASSLIGVVAQRLVRKICPNCVEPHTPDVQEQAWIDGMSPDLASVPYHRGVGCAQCFQTGYAGRQAVAEILEIDTELARNIRREDSGGFEEAAIANPAYIPLALRGLILASQGRTTLSEAMQLAGESH